MLAIAAMMTLSVTAELRMVPNQPLTFAGETDPRAEDGIIAYSWASTYGPATRLGRCVCR
jgi:PhoPQ-activated pathogenicity-related protein